MTTQVGFRGPFPAYLYSWSNAGRFGFGTPFPVFGRAYTPGAVVVVTPPEVTPPVGPEGAGAPVRRGQTHAPAFGRKRARELKDFLFPVPQPEGAGSAQPSAPKEAERGIPLGPSPLPLLADFGAGPVTIGLKLPTRAEMQRAIEADDEEAIIATLIALGMLD